MYTQAQFKKFESYPIPTILTSDLTDFLLSIIDYAGSVERSIMLVQELITIPNINQILSGLYKLSFINAIEVTDTKYDVKKYNNLTVKGLLTIIGKNILRFKSTSVLPAYAILISHYLNCVKDIIIIMAIESEQLDRLFIHSKEDNIIDHFKSYCVAGSDHLSLLNIYREYYLQNQVQYLNLELWNNIKLRVEQLTKTYEKIDIKYFDKMKKYINIHDIPTGNYDSIYYTLCTSHYINLLEKDNANDNDNYKSINYTVNTKAKVQLCKIVPIITNKYAIFKSLSDVFGTISYTCITMIPNHIIDLFKK
jgi:HrpA-like RNA helicase